MEEIFDANAFFRDEKKIRNDFTPHEKHISRSREKQPCFRFFFIKSMNRFWTGTRIPSSKANMVRSLFFQI